MRLIRWSVDHPVAVGALWLFVTLVSLAAALWYVPTRLMPAVESPLLGVITKARGQAPEEVERSITHDLEARLAHSPGVKSIRSMSMHGLSVVTLEYPYRYDMQRAKNDIVAITRGLDGNPQVMRIDPLNLPVMRLAVRASDRDLVALRSLTETEMVQRLKAVPGVESAYVFGGGHRLVDIAVDRERLTAVGLGLADLGTALKRAFVSGPSGTNSKETVTVTDVQRVGDTVVGTFAGQPVLLRDVATLDSERTLSSAGHGHSAPTHSEAEYRFNGVDALEINVLARSDASTTQLVEVLRTEVREFGRLHPQIEIKEAYDGAHFVALMRQDVALDLVLAVVLTGLVLYLFLGDWRGTGVALVTIPTSLACALLCFAPLGLSINSSSLVGLLLAIGRLVDDSIVDLSAVTRHLAKGKTPREAAIDGCSEVRRAVVSATVIVCLALLPLTVCGGLTQDMFVGIVWPFVLSLAASLGVAFTLTPMLAARAYPSTWQARPRPLLDRLEARYTGLVRQALAHRALVLCSALGICYGAVLMFPYIGSEMMPMADVAQAYGTLEALPGTTHQQLRSMVGSLEHIIAKHSEVQRVSVEMGSDTLGTDLTGYDLGDTHSARLLLTLSDLDHKRPPVWDIINAIQVEAQATLPHLRRLSLKEMGSDVMASSMAPIELVVYGPELDRVHWLAQQTLRIASSMPELVAPGTVWSLADRSFRVDLDPAAAARLGVLPGDVAKQLSEARTGLEWTSGPVTVSLHDRDDQRSGPESLRKTWIRGLAGHSAPLESIAHLQPSCTPTMITHDGLRRSCSVTACYRPGGAGSMQATMDLMMRAGMSLPFPPGYGLEQRGDMSQMMDSFARLLKGMALALGLIYLALAVQFASWRLPLVIMAAIPLELSGVFAALLLMHQTFSTVSLLGLVVLNGMDVTSSILLVDQMMAASEQDIAQAAASRLRPVLMTVLVTLVVMTPLALYPRGGLDAYAPLASVIVGGLTMSTPLTLLVVPVLYAGLRRTTRGEKIDPKV